MKKLTLSLCLIAILGLVFGGTAFADSGKWTGEVLDLKCYENGQKGEAHATCATRCLKGGSPMGLLVDGDVVYVDMEASDEKAVTMMKELGGKNVTFEGETKTEGEKTTVVIKSAKKAEK